MATTRRVVTTEELEALLAAGKKVRLPAVARPDDEVLAHYSAKDVAFLDTPAEANPIVSVERVADDEVQCISVDHPEHLYVTDDFIPTHNTANIVFLKSTDDTMLDNLQKMSGTRHVGYRDSKTVTKDTERLLKGVNVEGKVSYTTSMKEEPVIKYNDLAFLPERNSVVFRAGDPPIWNRNAMILPMSWRLFNDPNYYAGKTYSLQTIPTLSSALEFDVRMNQPDFRKLLDKRMAQAVYSEESMELYQHLHDLEDVDIERLDPDVYSEEVMELIDARLGVGAEVSSKGEEGVKQLSDEEFAAQQGMWVMDDDMEVVENTEVVAETAKFEADRKERQLKRYANQTISRENLVRNDGVSGTHNFDKDLAAIFVELRGQLAADSNHFSVRDGSLYSADGRQAYILIGDETEDLEVLNSAMKDADKRVYGEEEATAEQIGSFEVTDELYVYLASLPNWKDIAGGRFEQEMYKKMDVDDV